MEEANSTNRITIGKASIDQMKLAAKNEYHTDITPLVESGSKNNHLMEAYGKMVAIYAMEQTQYGELFSNYDGCSSDLVFKDKGSESVLGIQVKTTARLCTRAGKKKWRFAHIKNERYEGLLILLRCLESGEWWLVPYDKITKYYDGEDLCIYASGNTRLNWDKYKVSLQDLPKRIYKYYQAAVDGYDEIALQEHKDIIVPVSENTQKEHSSRAKLLPYLEKMGMKIEFSLVEDQVYDIILGDIKIQEKTSTINEYGTGFTIDIKTKKNTKRSPYEKGDFNALIVHNPDDSIYFIPENVLLKHGCISNREGQKGKVTLHLHPDESNPNSNLTHNWDIEFLLYRDDPNLTERLIFIYNMALKNKMKPIVLKNHILWKEFKVDTFNKLVYKWNLPRTYVTSAETYNFEFFGKRIMERNCNINEIGCQLDLRYKVNNNFIKIKYNDCDYIYCALNGDYGNYFYLIPMKFLKNKGIITRNKCASQIMFPHPDEVQNNMKRHWWIKEFTFEFDDPNIVEKLMKLIESY